MNMHPSIPVSVVRAVIGFALVLSAGAGCASPAVSLAAGTQGLVISQVYGGGGNSGATWRSDFVELFNAGPAPVSLTGWSVQYASAVGASWQVTPLGNVALAPGQYYLVQEATGAGGTNDLPTPDVVGSIAMSSSAGKVAVVSTTTPLSGASPSGSTIIDFVGFGTTASASEGSPAPAPSNVNAVLRTQGGCIDTNDNANDFAAAEPAPRNTASGLRACDAVQPPVGPRDVAIYTIQGSGATSTLAGQAVMTRGVVTRVNNNGFYLQDLAGDGDGITSDGVLVFTGAAPSVVAGQLVRVTGKVAEYNSGSVANPDTAARTVTQIGNVTAIEVLGAGHVVSPVSMTLPMASLDALERYEGMLVSVDQPMTVSQNAFLARYGQLTLSAAGRLETPTNRERPGASALALAAENAQRTIILDDGNSLQNPNPTPYLGDAQTVRAGDTVNRLTGVLDYGLQNASNLDPGAWRIHPTVVPSIVRGNARTAAPESVGGNVRVASFNVLNFFTTFTDGASADGATGQGCTIGGATSASNCRGANNLAEFERQRSKIVEALAAIDADVVGLMEIQNNGGVAVGNLVQALNAKLGGQVYAAVGDPPQGTGSDAIKVAMIYKTAALARTGSSVSVRNPVDNRQPLAQGFSVPSGERFVVVVNHLKSKSCGSATGADADQGDLQGCYNATRVKQARALRHFVSNLQLTQRTSDVLLIGDFNAYAKEDPIVELTNNGFVDQIGRFNTFGYSYVFNGGAGRLDHAITTGALSAKVNRAVEWHINADEPSFIDYNLEFKQPACAACGADVYSPTPYRASDHDPVVIGLTLGNRPRP